LVLEKLEGQRISTRSVRGIKFPERRRVCLDPFRRFTDGSGYAILAMAWGWGHGTTVCVVLSAAEREQLAAIVADYNRPRKHRERAPHRACLGRSALGAGGGANASASAGRRCGGGNNASPRAGSRVYCATKPASPARRRSRRKPRRGWWALTCAAPPHQATHWTAGRWLKPSASRWVRGSGSC
jgi:hypothetical protein